ncbi:MAG: hypothetical protein DLM69_06715 [Candidatus Chloroheliales bacterium]|nr:MAG: hypothetical protein DLM69_06715 [Chloroflexota bacterium]
MKIEPPIDHAALIQQISSAYGLPVTALTFVPLGEVGIAYVVDCADGRRYFAKLLPGSRQGRSQQAKLGVYLPITYELYERGLFRNLPCPIATSAGALHDRFGEYALTLFRYIEGQTLPYDTATYPKPVRDQLARAIATIHRATHLLISPLPPAAAFEMRFADDLRRGLAALNLIGPLHRPGQIALRDLLLPRRDALLDRLADTEQLADTARARATSLVLCHTDMGGDNNMVDAAGRVYILDWEDITLAPPEHDLQTFSDRHFADFLTVYQQAGGATALDPLQFAFYFQRRYLVDLTDWLIRILYENTDPLQDVHDLAGIQSECLNKLDNFTVQIANITQMLAQAAESGTNRADVV